MDNTYSFGGWLKARRKALRLTQEELAQQLNVALGTLRKWETDERRPTAETAAHLARLLQVPPTAQEIVVRVARAQLGPDQLPTVQPLLPASLPRPSTLPSHRANLPAPPTTLIGRAREVAEIVTLLCGDDVRLLTLVGPPGIGKTRLSIQAAAELHDQFQDGAGWVELASIDDPNLVPSVLALALEVQEQPGQTLADSLSHALRTKQILLVIDNWEQVVVAAPIIGTLLQAAPGLKVLATSRTSLHLYGEHEYAVPPLQLPPSDVLLPADQLGDYEAVRLFTTRARAVQHDFHLHANNVHIVADICRRLDGLPLAIELAAARIRLWQPEQLLHHLALPLTVLVGGARDLHPRHQTLLRSITWSYNLLGVDEQTLFRRLGVFVDGWTLESAQAICGTVGTTNVDVMRGLELLLEHNLVRQDAGQVDERWTMLATIRAYAVEQLAASDEAEVVQREHALYWCNLAEGLGNQWGATVDALSKRLAREHANVRAALVWTIQDGGDIEIGAGLASRIPGFWDNVGTLHEVQTWIERLLVSTITLTPAARTGTLMALAHVRGVQGDVQTEKEVIEEVQALAYASGQERLIAEATLYAGLAASREKDYMRAHQLFEASHDLFRALSLVHRAAHCRNLQAWNAGEQGDYERAIAGYKACAELWRELGDELGVAGVLNDWGVTLQMQGDLPRAKAKYAATLATWQRYNNRSGLPLVLANLGFVALLEHDQPTAGGYFRHSLEIARETGWTPQIARGLVGWANVISGGATPDVARQATRLLGSAVAWFEQNQAPTPTTAHAIDQTMTITRAILEEMQWATAWSEGQRMTLDEAVAYALQG